MAIAGAPKSVQTCGQLLVAVERTVQGRISPRTRIDLMQSNASSPSSTGTARLAGLDVVKVRREGTAGREVLAKLRREGLVGVDRGAASLLALDVVATAPTEAVATRRVECRAARAGASGMTDESMASLSCAVGDGGTQKGVKGNAAAGVFVTQRD